MRLIQKIEISYLRSLFRASVAPANDLNVIFGRNDSGKSNVLRALNLFFNEETGPDREANFDVDFSDLRRRQAQEGASRQFFAVKIWFNVPGNYRRSLGDSVYVKRQWNRYGEMTESVPRDLTKGSRIQLTKFLSAIDFTYVPAIKDLDVFEDLIQRMYNATAEGRGLRRSTEQFIDSIRTETSDLSSGLEKALGTDARLAAPTEMGLIFRSLDFAYGEEGHSLLLQKGDGVKARHIPELLRYINEKEKNARYFIWGFEEPENSLDLAAAKKEADKFLEVARRADTQIFVTSHSPAFYLNGEDEGAISRWFVSKQSFSNEGKIEPQDAVASINDIDSAEEKMNAASLVELPYVIRKLDNITRENEELKKQESNLRKRLEKLNGPVLFLEGKHDLAALRSIIRESGVVCEVKELGGTPSNTSEIIKRTINCGSSLSDRPTSFLFDNDVAGRRAYKNLCGDNMPAADPFELTENLDVWAWPFTEEFASFLSDSGIPPQKAFFPLEFQFEGEGGAQILLEILDKDRLIEFEQTVHDDYFNSLNQAGVVRLRSYKKGSAEWFWSRGVPDDLKAAFLKKAMKDLDLQILRDNISKAVRKF